MEEHGSQMYLSVLRIKEGERRALLNLDPLDRKALLPLFDVQPNQRGKPLYQHLVESVALIREVWPTSAEFLLDISPLTAEARCEDGSHPIAALVEACARASLRPTLCYAFDRSDMAYDDAMVAGVATANGPPNVAFRLQQHDLLFWPETRARLDGLVSRFGVAFSAVTVIADLQAIGPSSMPDEHRLTDHLLELHQLGVARVVLLASSMPESQTLKADTEVNLRRHEVALWESLLRNLPWLVFGDYGIVHPHFSHLRGASAPIPAPKARYATPDHWVVIKVNRPGI
jgi:hypothetical protein